MGSILAFFVLGSASSVAFNDLLSDSSTNCYTTNPAFANALIKHLYVHHMTMPHNNSMYDAS